MGNVFEDLDVWEVSSPQVNLTKLQVQKLSRICGYILKMACKNVSDLKSSVID